MPSPVRSYCPITAIIPTFNRGDILTKTLEKILSCQPQPQEIIVHIDGNDQASEHLIQEKFPTVKTILSPVQRGPGGGRNMLVANANCDLIASFDDDSYPLDRNFFEQLVQVFEDYPQASVVACQIFEKDQQDQIVSSPELGRAKAQWVSSFIGCGCAYRRADFLLTKGYLPIQPAYAIEEEDLGLQFYQLSKKILKVDWLRVYHDTNNAHHANANINSAFITNIALLGYLRYPVQLMPLVGLQVLNRCLYALKMGRYQGIIKGLLDIPGRILSYRQDRTPIPLKTLSAYLKSRHQKIPVSSASEYFEQ